jgi:hypothetical protein
MRRKHNILRRKRERERERERQHQEKENGRKENAIGITEIDTTTVQD